MLHHIDLFMKYLLVEKNASEKTIEAYNKDLIQFYNLLRDESDNENSEYNINVLIENDDIVITSVKAEEIRSYMEFCYDSGMAASSIERKLSSIKSFFKFLYNRDIIEKNVAHGIAFPKQAKKVPKFLYEKQVDEILSFELKTFLDYRDRALLEVFYSTGARISEITGAKLVYLDLKDSTLRVMGKGSVERVVFLTETAKKYLEKYLEQREKKFGNLSDSLFVNNQGNQLTERGIFYIINKRAKAAGYTDYVSPHTFRHSFATELLNNGADIRSVQEMLGHKHLAATQIYTHTTRKRLQKIYEKCHPHAKKNNDK